VIFLEDSARFWLIVHGVLGAALVASATHLVVWTWPLLAGKPGRWKGVRTFALVVFALYTASFALGNAIYPVYKVRVRVEYLDEASALRADSEARATATALVESRRTGVQVPVHRTDAPRLGHVSKIFDIKEHWVALGVPLTFALFVVVRVFDPRRDAAWAGARVVSRAIVFMSVAVAAAAWIGLLVGLYVTSFRAVGRF
jgi:hypothetical protein